MNNAVIYARFSSHGQNEQTIEGQIRVCKEFAESKGFNVAKIYHDKAKTGTNDNRPEFQRMIREAASGTFQYIIVYMFDRFARNRRDSIMYKEMLKEKYGVKVLSALEPISDDEGGEFYEMFLEWNAEKYSKRLSKRIMDGLTTAIENGTYTGARLIYGYGLEDTDKIGKKGTIKKVIIDEEQAEIVRYVFREYASGKKKTEISAALNAQGHRLNGQLFSERHFERWLINEKYTGTFSYGGRVCSTQFPRIIDDELFQAVQERLAANKHLAGSFSAREPYILTGKAYCGKCNNSMSADGATSKTGKHHKYYACRQVKKFHTCDKKREQKEPLERAVISDIIEFLSNPENVDRIVKDTIAHYEKRVSESGVKAIEVKITNAQKQVKEWAIAFVEAKSALLRNTIEKQIADYEQLLDDLAKQKIKLEIERGNKTTRKDIVDTIAEFINCDPNDKENWSKIIDVLVKKIFIYDGDHSVLFNFTDDDIESITLEDMQNAMNEAKGVQSLTRTLHQRKTRPHEFYWLIYLLLRFVRAK